MAKLELNLTRDAKSNVNIYRYNNQERKVKGGVHTH